jgi:hypothetical protein
MVQDHQRPLTRSLGRPGATGLSIATSSGDSGRGTGPYLRAFPLSRTASAARTRVFDSAVQYQPLCDMTRNTLFAASLLLGQPGVRPWPTCVVRRRRRSCWPALSNDRSVSPRSRCARPPPARPLRQRRLAMQVLGGRVAFRVIVTGTRCRSPHSEQTDRPSFWRRPMREKAKLYGTNDSSVARRS